MGVYSKNFGKKKLRIPGIRKIRIWKLKIENCRNLNFEHMKNMHSRINMDIENFLESSFVSLKINNCLGLYFDKKNKFIYRRESSILWTDYFYKINIYSTKILERKNSKRINVHMNIYIYNVINSSLQFSFFYTTTDTWIYTELKHTAA